MGRLWYDKPRVFKRYGIWMLSAPGANTKRYFTWGDAMADVARWWER